MKKKILIITLIIITISTFIITSCTTDNKIVTTVLNTFENENKLDVNSLLKFLNEPTDGTFSIASSIGVSAQNASNIATLHGSFYNDKGNTRSGGSNINGRATIGGVDVSSHNNPTTRGSGGSSVDHLFGQTAEFVISKSGDMTRSSSDMVVDNMYIPEKIELTPQMPVDKEFEDNDGLENQDPIANNSFDFITVGSEVKWNADLKNDKGVIFTVSYMASLNPEAIRSIYHNDFDRVFILPDNGYCKLPEELFHDIPENSNIRVAVSRGNFKYVSNDKTDDVYSVYAYSSVQQFVTFK